MTRDRNPDSNRPIDGQASDLRVAARQSGASRRLLLSSRLMSVEPAGGQVPILPNRQAARALGLPYRTLEELARRTVEDAGLHLAPRLISRRLLKAATYAVADTADPVGLARAVEPTLRELLRAGVDLEAVAAEPNARVRRLGAIATSYLARLNERGFVDPAQLFWRAAEYSPRPAAVCLSGFPRLPAAERAFLDVIAGEGSVTYLPLGPGTLFSENRDAVADLGRRGWQTSDAAAPGQSDLGPVLSARLLDSWRSEADPTGRGSARQRREPPVPGSAAHAYAYPDLDAEVRGTLAAVKGLLLQGVPAADIALVARDEVAYGPALLAVADEYRLPLRALYQQPLANTRVGVWLGMLLEALSNDFPFEITARLLSHPLVSLLRGESWHEARRSHTSGSGAWQSALPALGGAWPQHASRESFLRRLLALLGALGVRRNALRWPAEALGYAALVEELRDLPDREQEVTLEAFASEVSELLGVLTAAARPGRGGVELHTPLSLFGARVEHLFVLGAAEGILPSPVRPDPLLDPFEREELLASGQPVETVAGAAYREELSFWALLHSAGTSLTLSYPKLQGRTEALPSPFLARLGLEPRTAPARALCSLPELRRAQLTREETDDEVLLAARRAYRIESEREGAEPHGRHDGIVGESYRPPRRGVSVSRLIDLASCPFKFFAGTLLRLAEPEEADELLDPSLRGSLYHRTLQLALEGALGVDEPRETALAALDEAFNRAEEELQLPSLASWSLEREGHLNTLRRAIEGERFIRPGARIVGLEREFQGRWRGLPVRGRIDRIDSDPEGLAFIDYKSGGAVSSLAKDSGGRAALDLQLRVYREAAGAELGAGRPVVETLYYSLAKAEALELADPGEEELERVADDVQRAWREGAYPVDPDLQEAACKYCEFDALCRRGPRLERKRSRQ